MSRSDNVNRRTEQQEIRRAIVVRNSRTVEWNMEGVLKETQAAFGNYHHAYTFVTRPTDVKHGSVLTE